MKILAFDTSTKYLSVALLENENVVSNFHEEAGVRHSEILLPTVEKMLGALGWKIGDIELLCFGTGPGSFTGLRIAIATVKGLAGVLGMKVKGVPTMDAIVMNFNSVKGYLAPLLDAKKGKIYSCIYENISGKPERKTGYLLADIGELLSGIRERTFLFGDGIIKYKEHIDRQALVRYESDADWFPRAENIGKLGYERLSEGADDPETLEPLYLHEKECNITVKKI